MKSVLSSIILILLISLQSCKEDDIIPNPKNHFKQFSEVKSQIFDLGTAETSLITGEFGTKIFFTRDSFNVDQDDEIKAELKEIYDFKELLYNGISTITSNNTLLDSSGVIFIEFSVNGKKIDLKENKRLEIVLTKGFRNNNNELYSVEFDSTENFNWDKTKYEPIKRLTAARGLYIGSKVLVPKNLTEYYKKVFKKDFIESKRVDSLMCLGSYKKTDEVTKKYIHFENSVFIKPSWICLYNKEMKPDILYDLNLKIQNDKFENLIIYFVYEGIHSFKREFRTKDYLKFSRIPIIKNKTSLIVVAKKDNKFYTDNIKLTTDNNKTIQIRLKETNLSELRNLLLK